MVLGVWGFFKLFSSPKNFPFIKLSFFMDCIRRLEKMDRYVGWMYGDVCVEDRFGGSARSVRGVSREVFGAFQDKDSECGG
ncbi:hypothetical protein AKJ36_02605 [candidate division MSBL1 archaeon SCGC-AAA259I07]|uniref:Uncharacterized protein n=1 Tax=candidate division MSBL1 archaeon SCGC-AAA259I07 TaxID=1698266 RepID=A0A133UK40_9EURY|nr:hypothetical protein AKJ36_02605 [candidate division MSBL1 archaeon SCGC-AAA259I07]